MKVIITSGLLFFILIIYSPLANTQNCYDGTFELESVNNTMITGFATDGSLCKTGRGLLFLDNDSAWISAFAAFGPWMRATDQQGQIRGANSGYNLNGIDFYPGPIVNGTTDMTSCENWDNIFSVSLSDIDDLKEDWNDNGRIDGPVHETILSWPAKGNPHFLTINGFELPNQQLAPFVDQNQDGIFDPLDGDYPEIKGDVFYWWMVNDLGNIHYESELAPLGIEMAISCWYFSESCEEKIKAYFYNIDVSNKSVNNYTDFYLSLWMRPDLGCSSDDYAGCLPEEDLVFVYNPDLDGVHDYVHCSQRNSYGKGLPLVGIKTLDVEINSQNEETKMEYFKVLPRTERGREFVRPYANLGFDFSGAPDEVFGESMCSNNIGLWDFSMHWGIGPHSFDSGQNVSKTFVVFLTDFVGDYPCPSVNELINLGNELSEYCELINTNNDGVLAKTESIHIFPNPILGYNQEINIATDRKIKEVISTDLIGRSRSLTKLSDRVYSVAGLNTGVHLIQLIFKDGLFWEGKIVIH